MNYSYTIGSLIVFMGIAFCSAESFIVEEKQKKNLPNHQIKQEILDLMGRMAELESESIKTKAEIQKACCVNIRGYLAGDKSSFFARASRKDLQRVLNLLRHETTTLDKAIGCDKGFLASLQTPMIT